MPLHSLLWILQNRKVPKTGIALETQFRHHHNCLSNRDSLFRFLSCPTWVSDYYPSRTGVFQKVKLIFNIYPYMISTPGNELKVLSTLYERTITSQDIQLYTVLRTMLKARFTSNSPHIRSTVVCIATMLKTCMCVRTCTCVCTWVCIYIHVYTHVCMYGPLTVIWNSSNRAAILRRALLQWISIPYTAAKAKTGVNQDPITCLASRNQTKASFT